MRIETIVKLTEKEVLEAVSDWLHSKTKYATYGTNHIPSYVVAIEVIEHGTDWSFKFGEPYTEPETDVAPSAPLPITAKDAVEALS